MTAAAGNLKVDRSLEGETILVTGATGFIGSHLCAALHRQGARVCAVSRRQPAEHTPDWTWRQADLQQAEAVRTLITTVRPGIVFHLGSLVTGTRQPDVVLPTLHANLVSSVNLLAAVTEVGCRRIVLAGSLEEPDPGPLPPVPVSPYAAAKWASSGYARMFHALYQTPVVVAKLFMVYGPGQTDLRKLIPYVILSLLRGEAPRLSSGARPVDWIYVDDVVQGLLRIAHAPGVSGETVEIGSGHLVTVRDVVTHLARLIGSSAEPEFGDLPDRALERVRAAHLATTRAQLGWAPAVALEDGLRRTVDWYSQHAATPELSGGAGVSSQGAG